MCVVPKKKKREREIWRSHIIKDSNKRPTRRRSTQKKTRRRRRPKPKKIKKEVFHYCVCLEDFDEKCTLLLDANERRHKKNTHASLKDVFHFDSLRFADDGFCAQKDRRELARVQVRLRANTLVLLRVISSFWVAFFFLFLISFLPPFGTGKKKRFGCGPSRRVCIDRFAGSIGPKLPLTESRERRRFWRKTRRVGKVSFFLVGRFCSFEYHALERGGVLIHHHHHRVADQLIFFFSYPKHTKNTNGYLSQNISSSSLKRLLLVR